MYTILVLEDDLELNQTICNSLKENGYRVLNAHTYQERQTLANRDT